METTRRTIAKAVSWQLLGLVVMGALGYAVTGSLGEGGLVAVLGAACGMALYFVHEKIWSRVAWGRLSVAAPPAPDPAATNPDVSPASRSGAPDPRSDRARSG